MNIKQLQNNQIIIKDGTKTTFFSYNAQIATIQNGVLSFTNQWNYSKTTLKYLYKFLEEEREELNILYKELLSYNKYFINKNKKQYLQNLINDKMIIIEEA